MKINSTALGYELIPETREEGERLSWLIARLASHPDQQVSGYGSSDVLPMLDRNAESAHAQKAP